MLKVIILKYQNVIWEGRFQPIHIGHLSYIKRLLEYGDHLWIFVVENEKSTDVLHFGQKSPVPDFTSIVDTHHVNEKNPLPFWLRYRLVIDTIKFEFRDNVPITVLGGRRLDLAWDIYSKIFPPNRVFITPLRDSFEDCKAKAWRDLGEKVIRVEVDDLPKISATQVREKIKNQEPLKRLLSPATVSLLKQYGYVGSI